MKGKRKRYTASFKAKVALEAIKDKHTLAELSKKFEVHANMISKWKQEFLEKATSIFEKDSEQESEEKIDPDPLYARIGRLELENEFLKKSLKKLH
ncbi:transposase [Cytophagaceae bacterium DM2B3-1]|uniref:Transposase n=2 Tax=Xanthocytophaga flava TaxID=3048013 RepID=A0ABT7CEM3_9BACT|nr:transposase [Xanthocytophaga flavus]MDJ1492145.1 transposase [Xanthocytophaga flavus]